MFYFISPYSWFKYLMSFTSLRVFLLTLVLFSYKLAKFQVCILSQFNCVYTPKMSNHAHFNWKKMCVYISEKKIQLSWFLPQFYENMNCKCIIRYGSFPTSAFILTEKCQEITAIHDYLYFLQINMTNFNFPLHPSLENKQWQNWKISCRLCII